MNEIITAINQVFKSPMLTTAVVSCIPLIELKGAICFARASGLGFFTSLLLSYIGSSAVIVPVFFLVKPLLNLLKRYKILHDFAVKVEKYISKKCDNLIEKRKSGKLTPLKIKKAGIFFFVAVPLPLTGVWTGTMIAAFSDMSFFEAIGPIAVGNLVAGLIISVLAELFFDYIDYITLGLFLLAIVLLAVVLFRIGSQKADV